MPKVKLIRENKTIEVPEGSNLRKEILKAGVELYRPLDKKLNCRGLGVCGTCHVHIKNETAENASPPGFREKLKLAVSWFPIGHEEECRLACQAKVMGDLEVLTKPDFNWYGKGNT